MAVHAKAPVVIEGFTIIQAKYSKECKFSHYMYVKEHSVRESDISKPRDRTLFIANVPDYVTEESFKDLFSTYSGVENVYFHKKPTAGPPLPKDAPSVKGFKVAYVVFSSPKGVGKVKKTAYEEIKILEHPSIKVGLEKYLEQIRVQNTPCDADKLLAQCEERLAKYYEKVEEEKRAAAEQEGQPDEDGWVTVTRTGKNKGAPRTEANQKRVLAKEKKRRREKELLNFYDHQIRETKRNNIAKLRELYEADKRKIEVMKSQRKFKPY